MLVEGLKAMEAQAASQTTSDAVRRARRRAELMKHARPGAPRGYASSASAHSYSAAGNLDCDAGDLHSPTGSSFGLRPLADWPASRSLASVSSRASDDSDHSRTYPKGDAHDTENDAAVQSASIYSSPNKEAPRQQRGCGRDFVPQPYGDSVLQASIFHHQASDSSQYPLAYK